MNKTGSRPGVVAVVLGLLVNVSVVSQGASAGGPGEPAIAYWTDTNVEVADGEGQKIRTFPNFEHFSFNGSVLAGELRGKRRFDRRIVGYDIASGKRRFRIADAFLPVVAAGGKKTAFLPTARREDTVMSVWLRNATGKIRKILQFSAGRGLPGVRHGMRAGGGPLEFALDSRGLIMAVAFGLESIRTFDVWVVDVKTKEVTRMTRGNHSHAPSLSPNGSRLAVRVESTDTCPDVHGEFFPGKIRVFDRVTGDRKTLTEFSCDLLYDSPQWIDNDSLLATRVTRDATEEFGFDLDVVRLDVATGAVTEVITDGNPCCLVVSPGLRKVAFEFSDRPGFSVYDLESGTVVDFPEGSYVPHLAGQNRT